MNGFAFLSESAACGVFESATGGVVAVLGSFIASVVDPLHPSFLHLGPSFLHLGQGTLFTINWLWVAGALLVVWILISAMARRQTRLTGVLKEHVERYKEANKPPEVDENAEEGSG